MARLVLFVCVVMFSQVFCKPSVNNAENRDNDPSTVFHNPDPTFGADAGLTRMRIKRFVNPALTDGDFADSWKPKMRTRRNSEECEKLRLCKLHARSSRNFLAAFQLYFVNKENAQLWDHRSHSIRDCNQRFGGCYDYNR